MGKFLTDVMAAMKKKAGGEEDPDKAKKEEIAKAVTAIAALSIKEVGDLTSAGDMEKQYALAMLINAEPSPAMESIKA